MNQIKIVIFSFKVGRKYRNIELSIKGQNLVEPKNDYIFLGAVKFDSLFQKHRFFGIN